MDRVCADPFRLPAQLAQVRVSASHPRSALGRRYSTPGERATLGFLWPARRPRAGRVDLWCRDRPQGRHVARAEFLQIGFGDPEPPAELRDARRFQCAQQSRANVLPDGLLVDADPLGRILQREYSVTVHSLACDGASARARA